MPREYQMTWEEKRRRWAKMYNNQRYTVTPSVLSKRFGVEVPETKAGSYQFANKWWEEKKREIDSGDRPQVRPPLPMEDLVTGLLGYKGPLTEQDANFLNMLNACSQAGLNVQPEVRVKVNERGEVVDCWPASLGPHPTPEDKIKLAVTMTAAQIYRQLLNGQPFPKEMADLLPPARLQQLQDSVALVHGEPTAPPEKTVEAYAEAWLKAQQARVEAGQMTAGRCANNRTCLEHFKTFLGPLSDASSIDAMRLEGFYGHCLSKLATALKGEEGGWAVSYARDVFSVAKGFIRWLVERGTIDRPRNLDSKGFRFGSPAKTPQTWTEKEFKIAVQEATGKLKLALLLMANCGMTQEDISELRDSEVDWAEGRIIRKRSKTAACENVPTVNYKLWPSAFELLRKYRSGTDRVLLTEKGEAYVRTRLREDGKLSKADGFASSYVHLGKKIRKKLPGFKRPLKQLRKLGVSLLDHHKDYGRFSSYFLGHSPRTVAERHYIKPGQPLFDEAVEWIGYQLGQVPG